MNFLTSKERNSLVIAVVLILSLIFTYFLFSTNDQGVRLIVWGIISMMFSGVIAYTFVFQSNSSDSRNSSSFRYSLQTDSFSPRIIPPSKIKKRMQVEGLCNQCSTSALLGFTCSYCGGYYCQNHRLPEKHGCTGLYK